MTGWVDTYLVHSESTCCMCHHDISRTIFYHDSEDGLTDLVFLVKVRIHQRHPIICESTGDGRKHGSEWNTGVHQGQATSIDQYRQQLGYIKRE